MRNEASSLISSYGHLRNFFPLQITSFHPSASRLKNPASLKIPNRKSQIVNREGTNSDQMRPQKIISPQNQFLPSQLRWVVGVFSRDEAQAKFYLEPAFQNWVEGSPSPRPSPPRRGRAFARLLRLRTLRVIADYGSLKRAHHIWMRPPSQIAADDSPSPRGRGPG
jgi:hypothetical protein